jgi:general secretion pathway protein G
MSRSLDLSLAGRRRGFTLIELMLVMIILAILAGIAVPIIIGQRKKANINAAKAQVGMIASALQGYDADNGQLPTESQGLQALVVKPDSASDEWHRYLDKAIPLDPWGNPYQYKVPGNHGGEFDVYSMGPDGQDGTDDDIGSWTK